MKRFVILTAVFSLISIAAYNQSKTETEQWLLSKLNKYSLNWSESHPKYDDYELFSSGFTVYKNYKFRFEDPYLIIGFTQIIATKRTFSTNGEYDDRTSNFEYKIPLAYFQDIIVSNPNVKDWTPGVGYIAAIEYEIVVAPNAPIIGTSDGMKEMYIPSRFKLKISAEEEDNLPQRLKKAFLQLKTLYSKPNNSKPNGKGELY
jgi:hypothetical protein